MRVEYVARHYDLDDRVREFTESKLRKLDRYLQEPIEARLTLETEKHRHRADLHLAHRFGIIQAAEEVTEDMFDAINQAVAKAEKQARRSNAKFRDKRRRAGRASEGVSWPVSVLERASVGGGSTPRIVKSGQLRIDPMSIDAAAERLGTSKNDFFVFRNLETGEVNVLYKRRDDNYGLITPGG